MKKITPILTDREYLADVFARARTGMDTLTDEQCAALASGLRAFLASAKPVPMTPKELSLFVASAFAEHGGKLAASIRPSAGAPPPFVPCVRTLARYALRLPKELPDYARETPDDYDYRMGWNACLREVRNVHDRMLEEAGV